METGLIFYIWETGLIRRPSTGPTAKIDEKVAIDDGVDEPIHGANIGIAPKARSYRHRPRDVKQEKHLRQIPKRRKFRVFSYREKSDPDLCRVSGCALCSQLSYGIA